MKLVLVGPAYPLRGGISHYNSSLYRELSRDHSVDVVSFTRLYPNLFFPGTSQFDAGEDVFEIEAQPLIDPVNPLTWRQAATAIESAGPAAVVFQWWHSFFAPAYRSIASRLSRRSDAVLIVCCHNVFPHERPPRFLRRVEQAVVSSALNHFHGALVHSEQEQSLLEELAPALSVQRVRHPVYDFYSRWSSGRRPRTKALRLLFFGTVRRYKGLEVFLRALQMIAVEIDVQATVAGEFYVDQEPLRRIVTEGGLEDRIDWRDRYIPNEEVAGLFENADLTIVPYLSATQSGVIGVAYEFGVPVVASKVAGLAEAVQEGKTGMLVAPNDASAIADAVIRFERQEDPEHYRRAIAQTREQLGWGQVSDGILTLLSTERDG